MPLPSRNIPKLRMMNTFKLRDPVFLWRPYIPAEAVTMLYGPGGSGKSHIAVDIAARISRGEGLPGSDTALPPQKVLIMSAEDEPEMVLGPRLVKAGADLSKIAVPDRLFTLDKDGLRVVEDFIGQVSAGIVFIDPIVAYIGGKVDLNKANETRVFTGGLHILAQKTGVPIIVVHHTRKGAEGSDPDKAMGSADFINASRSALFTTQAPNGDRIMRHTKANYSAKGHTLGYKFGAEGFEWTGEYQDDGVMDEFSSKGHKRSEAADWLREVLQAGVKTAVEIERLAADKGFNHRTLVRAKAGVAESYLVSDGGKKSWYWRLIGDGNGEQTDVPVMGAQWGNQRPDRVQSEINSLTEGRVKKAGKTVGNGGSPRGKATAGNGRAGESLLGVGQGIDELMDRVWNGN